VTRGLRIVTRWLIFGLLGALALGAASPAVAKPRTRGSLTVITHGLPRGQRVRVVVHGPNLTRHVRKAKVTLRNLSPGKYSVVVKKLVIKRGRRNIRRGAKAYPGSGRVRATVVAGQNAKVRVTYGAIVNPSVARLPHVRRLLGDPHSPRGIVLPATASPEVGTIYTSAPTPVTPYGLVAKVTDVHERPRAVVADLRPVPVTEAAPSIDYTGALELAPVPGASSDLGDGPTPSPPAQSARAAADECKPPKLLKFHAHLDSVQVREASLSAFPPQLRLQFAVRTTESLGVAAAAVGINCDWTLGEIGPFQGAIPVGPVVIPVFATIPVKAGIHLNGRLDIGTVNVASTTVASVAAGVRANEASLSQQGSNVWLSGSPSLSGSARLYANVGVQAGIGVAKGANVHLQATFGPEFNWASGQSCSLALKFSGLQAGLSVFGKNFNSPGFKPWQLPIWTGCSGGGDNGGGAAPSPGGGASTPPGDGGSSAPTGGSPPPGSGGSPRVTLAQGPAAPAGYRYAITLDGYAPNSSVAINCYDSASPGGFYPFNLTTDGSGHASTASYCYSGDGPDHWVVAGGVESNHVTWGGSPQPPVQNPQTWAEQETPNHPVNTFTNYHNASGQGPAIAAGQWVQVSCKVYDPTIRSVNPDGYWYRIASSPWNNAYYSPANTFMNGDPYGGPYTHNTDFNVPNC
jgi:hypothetical protein